MGPVFNVSTVATLPWSQRFSFAQREKREKKRREKTSGSRRCKSHYHAMIPVSIKIMRSINKQQITTHLSVNNRQSEYAKVIKYSSNQEAGSYPDPSSLISVVNNCCLLPEAFSCCFFLSPLFMGKENLWDQGVVTSESEQNLTFISFRK